MQEYRNDKIVVRYDPKICIHAGECVASPLSSTLRKIHGSTSTGLPPRPRSPNKSSVVHQVRLPLKLLNKAE